MSTATVDRPWRSWMVHVFDTVVAVAFAYSFTATLYVHNGLPYAALAVGMFIAFIFPVFLFVANNDSPAALRIRMGICCIIAFPSVFVFNDLGGRETWYINGKLHEGDGVVVAVPFWDDIERLVPGITRNGYVDVSAVCQSADGTPVVVVATLRAHLIATDDTWLELLRSEPHVNRILWNEMEYAVAQQLRESVGKLPYTAKGFADEALMADVITHVNRQPLPGWDIRWTGEFTIASAPFIES